MHQFKESELLRSLKNVPQFEKEYDTKESSEEEVIASNSFVSFDEAIQKVSNNVSQCLSGLSESIETSKKQKSLFLTGATRGLSKILGDIIKSQGQDFYPIGSRDRHKLSQIAEIANKKAVFSSGNLFEPHSDAYKYCMEEVPESTGTFYFLSAIDMDPIPSGEFPADIDPRTMDRWDTTVNDEEKQTIRDMVLPLFGDHIPKEKSRNAIDPRTGRAWEVPTEDLDPRSMQPWDPKITEAKQEEIKKEIGVFHNEDFLSEEYKDHISNLIADQQISFFEAFIDSLVSRKSRDPLTVIFPNSILAKSYELGPVKAVSAYARMKNAMTQCIERNMKQLKEKNVYIKNVTIGITGTDMFIKRGALSALNSAKIARMLGGKIPLNQVPIRASQALDSHKVAEVLYELGTRPPIETPNRIELFLPEHIDIESQIQEKQVKREWLKSKIRDTFGDIEMIKIDDSIKTFLLNLRRESLQKYIETSPGEQKALSFGMAKGEEIVASMLEKKFSLNDFLDIAERLEGNYP